LLRPALQPFNSALKRGDIEELAQLLQNQPYAIAHPVVFRQIAHLSELLGLIEVPE